MSQKLLLKKYRKDVEDLKECAKNGGLTEYEIDEIFKECFEEIKTTTRSKYNKKAQWGSTAFKVFLLILFAIFCIYILLNVHQTTSSIVLRNVQGLTYPALKIIRILSVPIIKAFPALTDLYDETCLVENPYFYVNDMDCWPCQNVHSVIDLTDNFEVLKSYSGIPLVTKSNEAPVYFEDLQRLYKDYNRTLELEPRRIKSTDPSIKRLNDIFTVNINESSNLHIEWRVNKILPAQIIRNLFPRPYFLSDRSGQSVERFIIIDGAKSRPYILPNTECSFVFMVQGSGERTVVLKPTRECSRQCRTVSVVLKPSYILWYNWWYWRPISLPNENSSSPSISYINSYC